MTGSLEYEFIRVNDNFPCMACCMAIVGGEMTGDTDTIYPAGGNEISCYMTEEYSVGVSRVPFHNGTQTDSLYIL